MEETLQLSSPLSLVQNFDDQAFSISEEDLSDDTKKPIEVEPDDLNLENLQWAVFESDINGSIKYRSDNFSGIFQSIMDPSNPVPFSITDICQVDEKGLWMEALDILFKNKAPIVELLCHMKINDNCVKEFRFQGILLNYNTPVSIWVGSADKTTSTHLEEEYLCRICEKMIASAKFEDHSSSCAAVSRFEAFINEVNEDLDVLKKIVISRVEFERIRYPNSLELCKEMLAILEKITTVSGDIANDDVVKALTDWKCCNDSKTAESGLLDIGLMLQTLVQEKVSLVTESKIFYKELSQQNNPHIKKIDRDDRSFETLPAVAQKDENTTAPHVPSVQDFDIIKPISKGAYGRVYLAKKKQTGQYFAIKVIRKRDVKTKTNLAQLSAEQMILASLDSPFIVKIFYSFITKNNLYFVLEYLNGGDCSSLLRAMGTLDEEWTRQYAAQVVAGLEVLHQNGYIHRDLKPDNLLIDGLGHIKLTDFGLSKIGAHLNESAPDTNPESVAETTENSGRQSLPNNTPLLSSNAYVELERRLSSKNDRKTISASSSAVSSISSLDADHHAIGTADYMAPEVLKGTAHAPTMDWWSLGVIIYEFLYGIPPFNADTPEAISDNILNYRLSFPSDEEVSPEALDLMKGLMCFDPEKRLGYSGATAIKKHPFFRGVNWDKINADDGVFVPKVDNAENLVYFDDRGAKDIQNTVLSDIKGVSINSLEEKNETPKLKHIKVQFQDRIMADALNATDDQTLAMTFNFKNLNLLEKANMNTLKEIQSAPSSPTPLRQARLSTTFLVPSPLRLADNSKFDVDKEEPSFLTSEDKLTCLIAEDNPILRKVAETLLTTRLNCNLVKSCIDGDEALRYLLEKKVDFVLMDIQMPKLNGDIVTKRIKTVRNPNRLTPFIGITSYGPKYVSEALEETKVFDCVINKPLTRDKLLVELSKLAK